MSALQTDSTRVISLWLGSQERPEIQGVNLAHHDASLYVGSRLSPQRQELYEADEKCRFLEVLAQWNRIAARAKELNRPIVCFGD